MPHSRSKCDYLSGPGWLGVTHLFFSTIPIGETWKEQKGGGQQNTHGNDTYPIPLNTVTAEGLSRTDFKFREAPCDTVSWTPTEKT